MRHQQAIDPCRNDSASTGLSSGSRTAGQRRQPTKGRQLANWGGTQRKQLQEKSASQPSRAPITLEIRIGLSAGSGRSAEHFVP